MEWNGRSRIGQKENLNCNIVSVEDSANPTGDLKMELLFRTVYSWGLILLHQQVTEYQLLQKEARSLVRWLPLAKIISKLSWHLKNAFQQHSHLLRQFVLHTWRRIWVAHNNIHHIVPSHSDGFLYMIWFSHVIWFSQRILVTLTKADV